MKDVVEIIVKIMDGLAGSGNFPPKFNPQLLLLRVPSSDLARLLLVSAGAPRADLKTCCRLLTSAMYGY